jgi:vacuolar-type H+-ATPase subunit H
MTKQATKTEKPAYMLAALAKQKVDRMRETMEQAVADAEVKHQSRINDFTLSLSPEVREIFDALDGAE